MPSESQNLERILVRANDRKSSKKCRKNRCDAPKPCDVPKPRDDHKPCDVDCCIPDCNPDCCTPAFQRLDKLRNVWLLTSYSPTLGSVVYNISSASLTTSSVPVNKVSGVWTSTVYNRAGSLITTVSPLDNDSTYGNNELAAYAFVNEVRYLNFEECGKLDQVTGWSIDIQTGDLYFYQNLPELGLLTSDSRLYYLSQQASQFTPQDKQKLTAMEPFWKLSQKAVERVRENPKTEGNICEVRDKCGNRFLIAINRAYSQTSTTSVCDYNSQYSIVVVKIC